MKKILTILISSFLWCNISFAQNEEKPKWFLCEPTREYYGKTREPLYVKFHNTDKVWYKNNKENYKKSKWVKVKNFTRNGKKLPGVIPTLEVHEDKSRFEDFVFNKKIFPVYVSDEYYVFYQEVNDSWFWGTETLKTTARYIIMNRFNLDLLDYHNSWVIYFGSEFIFNDAVIEKLVKENTQEYINSYEDVKKGDGSTFKAKRTLHSFQCSEIEGIKPKI